jgi:hypothetical protein
LTVSANNQTRKYSEENPESTYSISGFKNNEKGWSCDNDVHEHFRLMTEQFIPNAFVVERTDGTIGTWNCTVNLENEKLIVTPAESVVSRIHFNLQKKHAAEIKFTNQTYQTMLNKGMQWAGPGMTDYSIPAVYLWSEMISDSENSTQTGAYIVGE